jgi:hypothetical protein
VATSYRRRSVLEQVSAVTASSSGGCAIRDIEQAAISNVQTSGRCDASVAAPAETTDVHEAPGLGRIQGQAAKLTSFPRSEVRRRGTRLRASPRTCEIWSNSSFSFNPGGNNGKNHESGCSARVQEAADNR